MVPINQPIPVTLQEAIDEETCPQEERDSDPKVQQLMDIALKLEGALPPCLDPCGGGCDWRPSIVAGCALS